MADTIYTYILDRRFTTDEDERLFNDFFSDVVNENKTINFDKLKEGYKNLLKEIAAGKTMIRDGEQYINGRTVEGRRKAIEAVDYYISTILAKTKAVVNIKDIYLGELEKEAVKDIFKAERLKPLEQAKLANDDFNKITEGKENLTDDEIKMAVGVIKNLSQKHSSRGFFRKYFNSEGRAEGRKIKELKNILMNRFNVGKNTINNYLNSNEIEPLDLTSEEIVNNSYNEGINRAPSKARMDIDKYAAAKRKMERLKEIKEYNKEMQSGDINELGRINEEEYEENHPDLEEQEALNQKYFNKKNKENVYKSYQEFDRVRANKASENVAKLEKKVKANYEKAYNHAINDKKLNEAEAEKYAKEKIENYVQKKTKDRQYVVMYNLNDTVKEMNKLIIVSERKKSLKDKNNSFEKIKKQEEKYGHVEEIKEVDEPIEEVNELFFDEAKSVTDEELEEGRRLNEQEIEELKKQGLYFEENDNGSIDNNSEERIIFSNPDDLNITL